MSDSTVQQSNIPSNLDTCMTQFPHYECSVFTAWILQKPVNACFSLLITHFLQRCQHFIECLTQNIQNLFFFFFFLESTIWIYTLNFKRDTCYLYLLITIISPWDKSVNRYNTKEPKPVWWQHQDFSLPHSWNRFRFLIEFCSAKVYFTYHHFYMIIIIF